MRVERLRGAILEGIPMDNLFAKPSLPLMQPSGLGGGQFYPPSNPMFRPAGAPPGLIPGGPMSGPMGRGVGRGRGLLGKPPLFFSLCQTHCTLYFIEAPMLAGKGKESGLVCTGFPATVEIRKNFEKEFQSRSKKMHPANLFPSTRPALPCVKHP